ncbi:MAG: holo-ACP synthase [Pseudomonadota bacterium]
MIVGIGTDLAAVARFARLYARHGERVLAKILAPSERLSFAQAQHPARFLAKRFAAKEAFGKALGTGVVAPATLPALAVVHSAAGQPMFAYAAELAHYLEQRGLLAHLSLSDEADFALAFVVLESR